MILDSNGKLFGKINIIDLSVLLIIVISFAAVVFKFTFSAQKDTINNNTKVTYTFKIKAIRQMSVDSLHEGTEIFDWETGKSMGKITGKRIEQAVEFVNMADGTLGVEKPIPNRFDVYLTVESSAKVTDDGYYLNGSLTITNYQEVLIYTRDIDVTGTIMNITT